MTNDADKKPVPAPDAPTDAAADLEAAKAEIDAHMAAYPGPKPPPALERLARLLAAGKAEDPDTARAVLGVEDLQPLDAFRDWGRENTRLARDTVADALRRALADVLDRKGADLPPDVLADLRKWAAEDANPEALADWLNRDGWGKVDGAAVEAALVTAARATAEADGLKDGLACVLWNSGAPYFVLLYDTARADVDKPDVRERIARKTAPHIDPLAALLLPEGPTPPDKATVLLGLDALKAGLQGFDWGGLVLCLTDKAGRPGDWLGRLAVHWMDERRADVVERLDRQAAAVGIALRPKAETAAGKWTPLPRVLDVAAALGGPFAVDVDGETYAPEPGLAPDAVGRALRPRGLDIVPADWLGNPAQQTLALDPAAPPEAVREYMIETAARTAHLAQLPNMCPKLLGFMFAAAPMTGRPVKGTLLDLARWLYPDWATGEGPTVKPWKERRQSKRDLQALGAAFVACKGLRLVETKADGTRHPYDLFTVDYDLSCKPDAVLGFMVNPWLVERMKGGKGGGFFLLNMTRWLALGIKDPGLFPLALRLAALWDGARVHNGLPDPARLRPIEADRLAWECNTLPEGAAMFKTGKTDARAAQLALTTARAKLEARLDALWEAGLLGPWKGTKRKVHGAGWTMLPMWPEDYPEACKRAAQAVRKTGDGRRRKGPGKGKG